MPPELSEECIQAAAARSGLTVAGTCTVDDWFEPIDRDHLREWQAAGHAGDGLHAARSGVALLFPQFTPLFLARTVISVAVHYERSPRPMLPHGHGRVARYAWGADYHTVLPALLGAPRCRVAVGLRRS